MQIGLKNLFYAKITEDASGNESYGVPKRLAKLVESDINKNTTTVKFYADDGADVTISEFVDGTITLGINNLDRDIFVDLFGAEKDSNGALVDNGEDRSADIALGFQSPSAKGGDVYVWLYRVTLTVPNESYRTKGETIEFTNPSIEGTFSRRNKLSASGKHPYQAKVKAGDAGVSASTIANWFANVYEPAGGEEAKLSALTIGSLDLSPEFDEDVFAYSCETENASDTITATSDGAVAITVNGNSVTSGTAYTWASGENDVVITVTKGGNQNHYTIKVIAE